MGRRTSPVSVVPMENDLIIQTKALTKSYGPHMALEDLNLSVPRGATGLLGQNGAGKSTFLKTILGLIQATSGEGTVLGTISKRKELRFYSVLATCQNTTPLILAWMQSIK